MRRARVLVLSVLAVAAAVVDSGCKRERAGRAAAIANDPVVAAWRADLALVARELTEHHPAPFARISEPAFRAAVAELDRALPTLTADQRLVRLAGVIALVGDAHTNLMPSKFAFVMVNPLKFYWFTDGVHVIAAGAPYGSAVGARVVSVAGRPIDEVTAKLSTLFGWEAEGFRRQQVAFLLTFAVALRGAGVAPADGPTRFGLVDATGAPRELVVEPQPWRGPEPEAAPPLARRHPNALYWSEYLPAERALYVQYNHCEDGAQLSFADFTTSVAATLDRNPVDRLVIDLRDNAGGNSDLIKPLLAAIAARPPLRGRVVVLIGRATFSSAVIDAIWLDQAGALLVGEPAGCPASHFGEIHKVPLPGTGNTLVHSTKWHDYPGYPGPALAPEVVVEQSSAQYFAGEDPALAAALTEPLPVR